MTVTGTVTNINTSQALPGVFVGVVDQNGNGVTTASGGASTTTDNNGNFSLTSSALDSGSELYLSLTGFQPVIVQPGVFSQSGGVGLDPLSAITPAATAQTGAGNFMPIVLIGGAALLLFSGSKKKGAVGDIPVDWQKIAITGGLLVGGYFVGKTILQKLGILTTPDPNTAATTTAQATALAQAQAAATKAGAAGATYTADQYTGWANDIFTTATAEYTLPLSTTAQDKIVTDVIQANTLVDLQSLISAFGVRAANCGIFGLGCTNYDLDSFLTASLDSTHMNTINNYLTAQNINYQF